MANLNCSATTWYPLPPLLLRYDRAEHQVPILNLISLDEVLQEVRGPCSTTAVRYAFTYTLPSESRLITSDSYLSCFMKIAEAAQVSLLSTLLVHDQSQTTGQKFLGANG
ncbi:hypothetical protein RUM44_012690 [Polyplax serrata]|uniref:Uncharacterized protein n=1 Tax=Polyplax serrata TaxID=468196 RepID=A0ABR1BC23_POLSC